VLGGALRCCLDMTGGSFANISRRMARKSRILDFYGKLLASLPLNPSLRCFGGQIRPIFRADMITHIPELCPAY
jgi:hypothetical protein